MPKSFTHDLVGSFHSHLMHTFLFMNFTAPAPAQPEATEEENPDGKI